MEEIVMKLRLFSHIKHKIKNAIVVINGTPHGDLLIIISIVAVIFMVKDQIPLILIPDSLESMSTRYTVSKCQALFS